MSADLKSFFQNIGKPVKEHLQKAKLGRGVVGRLTYIALGVLGVAGLIAYRLEASASTSLLILGAGAGVVALLFAAGILWYGHNHPEAALLEGVELLHWKQLDQAAKDPSIIVDAIEVIDDAPPPKELPAPAPVPPSTEAGE